MAELRYKIADRPTEFAAIHRLNYQTFVEEIPQHAPNGAGVLVDRFHAENTYAICVDGDALVGMVAGRCNRPFSQDAKVPSLDRYLPDHAKAVEIRLLAVRTDYRHGAVFARLVVQLARHFRSMGCDLAVISGTVRQLELYAHLGFRPFGPLVGSGDAVYQPMSLTLDAWRKTKSLSVPAEPRAVVGFLPGPVDVTPAVRAAFAAAPESHRSTGFAARMARVAGNLCQLTGAAHVAVLVGTGTLANDAIAAQIRHRNQPGLVLANGEFGERLVSHARGWDLQHQVVRQQWGEPFDWHRLFRLVQQTRPAWIWAVQSETSTGMNNAVIRLRALAACVGADLCLDAISALGVMPVDLQGVWLASAVSGKGLAAYPGLAMVFHDDRIAPAGSVPRYLDLAAYAAAGGLPFTQSSNLVGALDCALRTTRWVERFQRIARMDAQLRAQLRAHGLAPLVPDDVATPGIITLAIPGDASSAQLARALRDAGVALAHESAYLRERNWLQICLMGEIPQDVAARLPGLIAAHLPNSAHARVVAGTPPRDHRMVIQLIASTVRGQG